MRKFAVLAALAFALASATGALAAQGGGGNPGNAPGQNKPGQQPHDNGNHHGHHHGQGGVGVGGQSSGGQGGSQGGGGRVPLVNPPGIGVPASTPGAKGSFSEATVYMVLPAGGLYIVPVSKVPAALAVGSRYAYEVLVAKGGTFPAGVQKNMNGTGYFTEFAPTDRQLLPGVLGDNNGWAYPAVLADRQTIGYPLYV